MKGERRKQTQKEEWKKRGEVSEVTREKGIEVCRKYGWSRK